MAKRFLTSPTTKRRHERTKKALQFRLRCLFCFRSGNGAGGMRGGWATEILQKAFPFKEKATTAGRLHEVVPLADFALIRRFAPPSPPGGRLLRRDGCMKWFHPPISPSSVASRHLPHPGEGFFRLCKILYVLLLILLLIRLLNPACKSALYQSITDCRSSLPPGGEGVAPATDEGEIGEWNHFMQLPCRSSLSLQKGRILSGILLLHVVPLSRRDLRCSGATAVTHSTRRGRAVRGWETPGDAFDLPGKRRNCIV